MSGDTSVLDATMPSSPPKKSTIVLPPSQSCSADSSTGAGTADTTSTAAMTSDTLTATNDLATSNATQTSELAVFFQSQVGLLTPTRQQSASWTESISELYQQCWKSPAPTTDPLQLLPTDDDDSSTQSVGYFDASDFQASNWLEAMEYVPTFGFALWATATVVFHPLMFLAGALTAVGMVQAVGVGYDFWNAPEECETTDKKEELPIIQTVEPVVYIEEPLDAADSVCENDVSVLEHYPPLEHTIVSQVEFMGLTALEFFLVFLDDHAPYSFQEFQKRRGDSDICYGPWKAAPETTPLSFLSSTMSSLLFERVLKFKTKTNSYLNPYARAVKSQRVWKEKKLLILESKTELSDIPFCDRFFVMERWVVAAQKQSNGCYTSKLSVHSQVFFTKKCPFEPQIRKGSLTTINEVIHAWCQMAQQALYLTQLQKEKRLLQDAQDDEDDADMGVEVQHSGKYRSCVVGEDYEIDFAPASRKKSSFLRGWKKLKRPTQ